MSGEPNAATLPPQLIGGGVELESRRSGTSRGKWPCASVDGDGHRAISRCTTESYASTRIRHPFHLVSMADRAPMLQDSAATCLGRISRRPRLETSKKEKSPMNARLAPFLIFSAALAAGCSQPGSPTSPTSVASSAQVATTPGAATFAADGNSAASTNGRAVQGQTGGNLCRLR